MNAKEEIAAILACSMVLAVNGMNIFFTNRDIKQKYDDPETARREGDHFATTLQDNVLQKMSPRGRVRPARVCFLDSRAIVETLTTGDYGAAYEKLLGTFARFGKNATPPETVARQIQRGLTARRPRARYTAGPDAKALNVMTRVLPDRAKDAIFGRLLGL